MARITLVNPGGTIGDYSNDQSTEVNEMDDNTELLNPFTSRQMKRAWRNFRDIGGGVPRYDRTLWSGAVSESLENPFRGEAIQEVWKRFKMMGGTSPQNDKRLWRRSFDLVKSDMPINRPWRAGELARSKGMTTRARGGSMRRYPRYDGAFPAVTGLAGAYGNPGFGDLGGMMGEGYEKYLLGTSMRDLGGILGGVAVTALIPPAVGRAVNKEELVTGVKGVIVMLITAIAAGHIVMKITGDKNDAQMVMIGGLAATILQGLTEVKGREFTLPSLSGDELLMLDDEDALLGVGEILGGEFDEDEEDVLIL